MCSLIARKIELLAPAGNAEIGIEAVNHGADAVYIGAPQFSARAAAGNSAADIGRLADYAHQFRAKVYVALNTVLYDSELSDAERIIRECYSAGADAFIVQDMGISGLPLPPVPLHASTQCDNRNIDKIRFLEQSGFSRVILARELSLDEIKEISAKTSIELEAFVHGAICVSYSGQCYISQAVTGRSANRGECAQFCRLPYTLQDSAGKILSQNRHLLSLKDLNQSENLERLLDAGVTSFKIEGRLKEISYVKNITAFYRRKLDAIIERRPEFVRASSGVSTPFFVPEPAKSFNRGFTSYFLTEQKPDIASPYTPKSLGEPIGNVKDLNRRFFTISGRKAVHNGDGLCFFNERKELQGFRVNRVDEDGKIYPAEMPSFTPGITLYRNFDHEFEKTLAGRSAERKLALRLVLDENNFGYSLTAEDEDNCRATVAAEMPKEKARTPQNENIRTQLSKLGNTPFSLENLEINLSENRFIPVSALNDLRRRAIEALLSARKMTYFYETRKTPDAAPLYPEQELTYLGNVANKNAETFYKKHGVSRIEPAFELHPANGLPVMFTKHCILRETGRCKKEKAADHNYVEPLYVISGKNRFELRFDCRKCEMQVIH
ncbi:MAG: U32 family peptidase [Dysgonamonadaceae bacterium]|jgi:putative protease|nr:U32 family peptidase [Dysgonamonadaceae bacterium]